MSASGFTPIQIYRTTTAAATPSAGNLAAGELAINLTDEKLYFKNASGVVKLLASSGGSLGSVTSVDVSGGTTGLTTSGGPITSSGTITLAGTLAVGNGGTGATSLTSGYLLKGNGTSAVSASVIYDTGTNVGIGTTAASYKLDVRGAISVSTTASGSAPAVGGYFGVQGSGLSMNSIGATPLSFYTNSVLAQTIDSAGNVGIGPSASTPQQLLHIRKDQDATTALLVHNRNGTGTPVSAVQFITGPYDIGDARYAMISSSGGSNTTLQFYTGNGATPTEKMRIFSTGGVSIGNTTDPGSTNLSVTGFVSVVGDVIQQNGVYFEMTAPGTKAAAATLTGAEVVQGYIQYTGAAANLTLPTATDLQAALPAAVSALNDMAFDFTIINTGSGTATLVVNTGITSIGALTTASGTATTFHLRKTATNTFIVYRT